MDWKTILAKALHQFLMDKPEDWKEALRRTGIAAFAVLASMVSFTVARHPEWVSTLSPKPVNERRIETRFADDKTIERRVVIELETWFYSHRPHGLMLVSWHDLDSLTGLWVRPRGQFPEKESSHSLTSDMRVLAGPFVFGECATASSLALPGKTMVACPIYTEYDVWGYVAAVVDPAETSVDYTQRSISALAFRIRQIIYPQ